MPIHPKAVLFDMDGVLFDSMKNHTASWYRTMTSLNIPCTRDEFYLYEGCTGKDTINSFFRRSYRRDASDKEILDIYETKSSLFKELPEPLPMAGAREVVEDVVESGLKIVLVTGSGQKSLLERLGSAFPGIFSRENMVTAFDVKEGKPSPEPYLKGLVKAGVARNEAIVVENAPMGVRAGHAAGIFTVAVNTGPIPDQALMDEGADILFRDMSDFHMNIKEIIS